MSVKIQLVTAVNNWDQYACYIRKNPFYQGFDLVSYDNTVENVPVPLHYNAFIEQRMLSDAWVIFCHQDFSIREDLVAKLENLPHDCLYGAIGIDVADGCSWTLGVRRGRLSLRRGKLAPHTRLLGQYWQGFDGDETKAELRGIRVSQPCEVETLDGCCLILHASLIQTLGLRFDPLFAFSLFVEDLSIHVKHAHGIKTKVLQLECFHLSTGGFSADYYEGLLKLIEKYPGERLVLTGSDEHELNVLRYLQKSRHTPAILKCFNLREKKS